MAAIGRYGSLPSTPTDDAQPTSASDAMLPGDATLTKISSLAGSSDRYQKPYDRYYSSRRGWQHGCVTADQPATAGRFEPTGRAAGRQAQR